MKKTFSNIFAGIGIPLILIGGTCIVYFLARGYQINFDSGEIERTGVISLKTYPRGASIYLDDEYRGKTSAAFGSVSAGLHTISLTKEGYSTWATQVSVKEGQLLPLQVLMLFQNPPATSIFPPVSDDQEQNVSYTLVDLLTGSNNTFSIMTVIKQTSSVSDIPEDTPVDQILQLWVYPATHRFLEFGVKERLIAEFPKNIIDPAISMPDIEARMSENGQQILIQVSTSETDRYFLLTSDTVNDPMTELTQLSNTPDADPVWSHDSQFILFQKNGELRAINVNSLTQSIIAENIDAHPFVWTTNASGQILTLTIDGMTGTLAQINGDGTGKTTRAEIPFGQGNLSEETTDQMEAPTIAVSTMHQTPDGNHIVLFTAEKIILYEFGSSKLTKYAARNPQFVSFSPDMDACMYLDSDNSQLKLIRYDTDDGDPLHAIGSQVLADLDQSDNARHFSWHPLPTSIFYSISRNDDGQETYRLVAVDIENLRRTVLPIILRSSSFSIDSSGKSIFGRCDDGNLCRIDLYK